MNLFWLLTHFDVFCVLLLTRRRAIWNLFVKQTLVYSVDQVPSVYLHNICLVVFTTAGRSSRRRQQWIVFTVTQQKTKSTTIQWKKLRNFDVIDDNEISHFSKFQAWTFSQTSDIRRNVSQKFTEPSMETPCWCTSVVHQYGGRKIVLTLAIQATNYQY